MTRQLDKTITKSIIFATQAHGITKRKGATDTLYIFHPLSVAREIVNYSQLPEIKRKKAIILANLHDTVEDTNVTLKDIEREFGIEMCHAVAAISKDPSVKNESPFSKEASLRENLIRLKKQDFWVQSVRLADRSTNLEIFPAFWKRPKIEQYLRESQIIADELGIASAGLYARLLMKIQSNRNKLSIAA